jgi:alpha-mannosidase
MFKFGMDIPKGATTVTLPDHADIVLFAATLVNEKYPAVTPASELFRTALKAGNGEEATSKANLLKQAKLIKCSGETNEKEVARYAVDGDVKTKWCDTSTAPNYIDFDFGKEQTIRGWKLVNAGNEGSVFITHTCFLQGRNSPDEEWKTIDELSDNKKNTVVRQFKPTSVRYVRLLVTQSTQNNSLKAARIYELEVY